MAKLGAPKLSAPDSCPKCGVRLTDFSKRSTYYRHLRSCANIDPKVMKIKIPTRCPKCKIKRALYSSKHRFRGFRLHIQECDGTKRLAKLEHGKWHDVIECPKCGVSGDRYRQRKTFIDHLRSCTGKPVEDWWFGTDEERRIRRESIDMCPKCGIPADAYSKPTGLKAHIRRCTGVRPKDSRFVWGRPNPPSVCPKCGVREKKYASLSTWKFHLRKCDGVAPHLNLFSKKNPHRAKFAKGGVTKSGKNSWTARINAMGVVCSYSCCDQSRAALALAHMTRRTREVVGGLFSGNEEEIKRYVTRPEDPYEKKDQMRRTWTEWAWQFMRPPVLQIDKPRVIMLPGLRPADRQSCFTQPYLGRTCRIVLVEREEHRAKMFPNYGIVIGDFFETLYEKSLEKDGTGVNRFSFVDFDICEQPAKEIVGPFKEMVKRRSEVLTSPCAVRIVTSKRPKKCGRERSLLSRYIHDRAKVLNYIEMPYSSTGTPMHMQQWVIE